MKMKWPLFTRGIRLLSRRRMKKINALEDQMKMQDHELAVVSQELENMKADSEARQTKNAPKQKGRFQNAEI